MKKINYCNCDPQSNYECGGMMAPNCEYITTADCAELALCASRHDIPQAVDGSIYENQIEDPTDTLHMELVATRKFRELGVKYVDIYVTGLTPALIAALNAARRLDVKVMLYHFDKTTGGYFSQPAL